jgi:hypothetical protein
VHPNQGREDAKREKFLVVLAMHNERAGSVKDARRRWTAARIPDSIRFRRDPQLGSERNL